MESTRKIAILLKHHRRLKEARHCAKAFMDRGAAVTFLCLCRRQCPQETWNIQPLLELQAQCCSNDADMAGRYHLDHLSHEAMADYLKDMDWVIPF